MRYLYLNNFRGFSSCFIPIMDVNFLVGENSTGKSSLLSLLKIVSGANFWRTFSFNTDEVELGYFEELASNNLKGKKFFEFGFYAGEPDWSVPYTYTLAKFTSVGGEPVLTQLRYLFKNISVCVTINDGNLEIRSKEFDAKGTTSLISFKRWVKDDEFLAIAVSKSKSTEDSVDNSRFDFYDLYQGLKMEYPKLKMRSSISLRPRFLPYGLVWVAPIRIKPKRIYEGFQLAYSPEGNHTPLVIKGILSNKSSTDKGKIKFVNALRKFGKVSGLFDAITIEHFGSDASSPFSVNVHLNKSVMKLTSVGYGIGQILPVLTEILTGGERAWFMIQQPEVHLHPKAQAALGDFIHAAAITKHQKFLIETHSDFVIDRFRFRLKRSKKKVESQVLFFEHKQGKNIVQSIPINSDGQFDERQPKSFRNFFLKEQLNLLQL